ncbi:MAG: PaaI family thioesterase [Myxococcaceae bacterium]
MPHPKPTPEQLARYADAFNQSQTLEHFGVKVRFPDLETVEVVLDPIKPEQRGGLGSDAVNGGVLAAIFDLVIGCAPALVDPTLRSATVQLSLQFMSAVRGSKLTARAKVLKGGSTLVFASASIFDEQGAECATATGMSRLSSIPWASGGTPAIN